MPIPRIQGLAALLLAAWPAAGQDGRPSLRASRIEEGAAPSVDGRVEDAVWAQAEAFTGFTQQQPDEGQPSSERTEVRVLHDRRNLYIGIVCFDTEPDKIVVTQGRRDADLADTDSVQVILDTFNDHQNAFLFGTNPLGLEHDGQIAAEGQAGGVLGPGQQTGFGASGAQRGQLLGYNKNWDGDWTVRSQITERGWETEMVIPLKTLRYDGGPDRHWGINVMRNIRRKNEQAFLAPIPRAFNIYRVSLAGHLNGLDLPARRDLRATPFGLTGFSEDNTLPADQDDTLGDVGLDVKWGITPKLTADFTVNTDFAQVEADEEQINFTRFDLFFPEKRPFFLENAATFQFGQPQQVDLFFSRRIGLSRIGEPIDILGGARLSGKVGRFNIGVMDMQTEEAFGPRTGLLIAPANNFAVARVQREVGQRSSFGAIFVNRQGTGDSAADEDFNRAYGLDANLAVSKNARLFAFLARSDSPQPLGSDWAGRAFFDHRGHLWEVRGGYTQVGEHFNAEVGFVPRTGYRKPEIFVQWGPEPRSPRLAWVRRFTPHVNFSDHYGFEGELQTRFWHVHFFEVFQENGGRFGTQVNVQADRPAVPFTVYTGRDGTRVTIPPGYYEWTEWAAHWSSDPSGRAFFSGQVNWGGFYDGDRTQLNVELGAQTGHFQASLGYIRNDVALPGGEFTSDLARLRATYSFTPRVLLQALVQYNSQVETLSANIRFAWLSRTGTGLFVVFNENRDTYVSGAGEQVLGRALIVKYTRQFDF
ncbi:MAG TPA: DUF5916 domain-containing protein [Vicinamibacteria bacterium]|nr:DUF5916 domain-containing protein [Vicinamibacteria bacterium]